MREVEKKFYKEFPNLEGNKAVEAFLKKEEYQEILIEYLQSPSQDRRDRLNEAFKVYYFGLRFTSYISTSLYFHSVNFDKKVRRIGDRHPLTLDQSIGDEEGTTFKDQLVDEQVSIDIPEERLEDCLEDKHLLAAYQTLTMKQKQVLDLAYRQQLKDRDSALLLGISQQAVSKTRQQALTRLRRLLMIGKE